MSRTRNTRAQEHAIRERPLGGGVRQTSRPTSTPSVIDALSRRERPLSNPPRRADTQDARRHRQTQNPYQEARGKHRHRPARGPTARTRTAHRTPRLSPLRRARAVRQQDGCTDTRHRVVDWYDTRNSRTTNARTTPRAPRANPERGADSD